MEINEQYEAPVPVKDLFRIGEVSRLTATKPFVLRYWETEFPMLQPVKSSKGHRLYRREDVDMIFVIKRLLYEHGFTIAGARRHLHEQSASVASPGSNGRAANGDSHLRHDYTDHDTGHDYTGRDAELFRQTGEAGSSPISGQSPRRSGPSIDRQVLLDLRDSLRSLLTVLESE